MTVCNACRYCEQYCPVFPAMEQRLTFREGRPQLPREPLPQLRRVSLRVPVRAAARVRRSTCRGRWHASASARTRSMLAAGAGRGVQASQPGHRAAAGGGVDRGDVRRHAGGERPRLVEPGRRRRFLRGDAARRDGHAVRRRRTLRARRARRSAWRAAGATLNQRRASGFSLCPATADPPSAARRRAAGRIQPSPRPSRCPHAPPPARERRGLRDGGRGPHAVAALVPSRHVLRLHALLRVNVRCRAVSHRVRVGGAVRLHEPSRRAGHARRRGPVDRAGRTARRSGAAATAR